MGSGLVYSTYSFAEVKSFVQDVTPALLANIEAEFDKVAQMDPPQPTRTSVSIPSLSRQDARLLTSSIRLIHKHLAVVVLVVVVAVVALLMLLNPSFHALISPLSYPKHQVPVAMPIGRSEKKVLKRF